MDFRICADGLATCSKVAVFSITYNDLCDASFDWSSPKTPTVDKPSLVLNQSSSIYDVIISSSSTGTLSFTLPAFNSLADCGTSTKSMWLESNDNQHMAYYSLD